MNQVTNDSLQAISPIDGRYASKTSVLRLYFSEEALIRYRCLVEIRYFLALTEVIPHLKGKVNESQKASLNVFLEKFSTRDAEEVKGIEAVTNHDVKAIEYFIKKRFDEIGLIQEKEFVHFGLTSQDINNTAFPLMLKEALVEVYYPALESVVAQLQSLAEKWEKVPMLARTHGQPASPTRLGKEIDVFVYRLRTQIEQLQDIPISAKFGGATGNYNAHHVAFPKIDWKAFGDQFVKSLGLEREAITTQISNYDNLAALLEAIARINTILIDLSRDVWIYISLGYFKQKIKAGEVGSSAMPHKVNPIDFENAEGNLMLANALLLFLAQKLPISRLQRDLTDSTVLRNEGMPLAYGLIALKSLAKGLDKLILDEEKVQHDLEENYEVVAEAIQTVLRREAYPEPYEALKALTRTGRSMSAETIAAFIGELEVSDEIKKELSTITPLNYFGI